MAHPISKRVKGFTYLLTLVYFGSYIMRINFAAMLATIYPDIGVTKSAIAVVITGMTLFYGSGQIINGILGDKINPKYMLTVGLSLAAACNIGMSFCQTVPWMTAVWCINGYAHSMLWPPIVRLMSTHLNDVEYNYATVRLYWGSSCGTILIYMLCPLLLKVITWRWIIACYAVMGIAIVAVWLLFSPRVLQKDAVAPTQDNQDRSPAIPEKKAVPLPSRIWISVVMIFFAIILMGMLRDGVTNWMPSYLLESFGMPAENAIFATVILAVFSMISYSLFDTLHRKVFPNEIVCAAVIFGGAALCGAILYVINLFASTVITSMLLMALIVACTHGVNMMLISIVPKRFAKSGKVSTFSGLLNAGTYVGAAIATPVFALIAENYSWNINVLVWGVLAAVGTVICLAVMPLWKKFRKEYSDNPEV